MWCCGCCTHASSKPQRDSPPVVRDLFASQWEDELASTLARPKPQSHDQEFTHTTLSCLGVFVVVVVCNTPATDPRVGEFEALVMPFLRDAAVQLEISPVFVLVSSNEDASNLANVMENAQPRHTAVVCLVGEPCGVQNPFCPITIDLDEVPAFVADLKGEGAGCLREVSKIITTGKHQHHQQHITLVHGSVFCSSDPIPSEDTDKFCSALVTVLIQQMHQTTPQAPSLSESTSHLNHVISFSSRLPDIPEVSEAASAITNYCTQQHHHPTTIPPMAVHSQSSPIELSVAVGRAISQIQSEQPGIQIVYFRVGFTCATATLAGLLSCATTAIQHSAVDPLCFAFANKASEAFNTALAETQHPIVVILDGIDQLNNFCAHAENPASWLPRRVNAHVRLIVTFSNEKALPKDFYGKPTLDIIRQHTSSQQMQQHIHILPLISATSLSTILSPANQTHGSPTPTPANTSNSQVASEAQSTVTTALSVAVGATLGMSPGHSYHGVWSLNHSCEMLLTGAKLRFGALAEVVVCALGSVRGAGMSVCELECVGLMAAPQMPPSHQFLSSRIFSLITHLFPILDLSVPHKDSALTLIRIVGGNRKYSLRLCSPTIVTATTNAIFEYFTKQRTQPDIRRLDILLHHIATANEISASMSNLLCDPVFITQCVQSSRVCELLHCLWYWWFAHTNTITNASSTTPSRPQTASTANGTPKQNNLPPILTGTQNPASVPLIRNIIWLLTTYGEQLSIHKQMSAEYIHNFFSATPQMAPTFSGVLQPDDEVLKRWRIESRGGAVYAVAFSPDASFLASGHQDGSIRIHHCNRQFVEVRTLFVDMKTGNTDCVHSCAFSSTSQVVAVGCQSGNLLLWDLSQEGPDGCFRLQVHTEKIWCCRFAHKKPLLACASFDKSASITRILQGSLGTMELQTGTKLRGHSAPVNAIDFSPDDSRCVTCSDDKTVRVWDVESGDQLFACRGHTSLVLDTVFSVSGANIVSVSADRFVRFWKSDNGQGFAQLAGHTDGVQHCAFFPSESFLATLSSDSTTRIWNCKTQQTQQTITFPTSHNGSCMTLSNTLWAKRCNVVATGGSNNTWIVLCNPFSEQPQKQQPTTQSALTRSSLVRSVPTTKFTAAWGGVTCAHFYAQGDLVALAYFDHTVRLFRVSKQRRGWFERSQTTQNVNNTPQQCLELVQELRGHEFTVYCCQFSQDGSSLVSSSADGNLCIWQRSRKNFGAKPRLVLRGHMDTVWSCAFVVFGSHHLILSCSADGTIRAWDNQSGEGSVVLESQEQWVSLTAVATNNNTTSQAVCLSNAGRLVAVDFTTVDNSPKGWASAVRELGAFSVPREHAVVKTCESFVFLRTDSGKNIVALNTTTNSHATIRSPFAHMNLEIHHIAPAVIGGLLTVVVSLSDGTIHALDISNVLQSTPNNKTEPTEPTILCSAPVAVGVALSTLAVENRSGTLLAGSANGGAILATLQI